MREDPHCIGINFREEAMRTIDDGRQCQKMNTRLQKSAHFDTPKGSI